MRSSTGTTWSFWDRATGARRYARAVTSEPPATLAQLGQRTREASRVVARTSSAVRDEALRCAADLIERRAGELLEANGADMARATGAGVDATAVPTARGWRLLLVAIIATTPPVIARAVIARAARPGGRCHMGFVASAAPSSINVGALGTVEPDAGGEADVGELGACD